MMVGRYERFDESLGVRVLWDTLWNMPGPVTAEDWRAMLPLERHAVRDDPKPTVDVEHAEIHDGRLHDFDADNAHVYALWALEGPEHGIPLRRMQGAWTSADGMPSMRIDHEDEHAIEELYVSTSLLARIAGSTVVRVWYGNRGHAPHRLILVHAYTPDELKGEIEQREGRTDADDN